MKGDQVVTQRRNHAAQSPLQAPDLRRPLFDALSQSLKLRRQDRARLATAHRTRAGLCVECGAILAAHFAAGNQFVSCVPGAFDGE